MPGRWVSIAILVFWLGMTASLVFLDVYPRQLGGTPSFQAVLPKVGAAEPVHWTISDDRQQPIGRVESHVARDANHWAILKSEVHIDNVYRIGPLGAQAGEVPAEIRSTFYIRPRGDLDSFEVSVRLSDLKKAARIRIHGHAENNRLVVRIRGMGLDLEKRIPYQPRSLVGDVFSPTDRLPGLRVGQTWREDMLNPLTKQVEQVSVRVSGEEIITWHDEPTPALVVIQRFGGIEARCWVRRDGLVLRQQVPLYLTTWTLEREPSDAESPAGASP